MQALQKKLQGLKTFPQAQREIEEQLARLLPKDFIAATPWERLQHFPRYLKAVALRLDKLRADPARDARCSAEFNPLWQHVAARSSAKQKKSGRSRPAAGAVPLAAGGTARVAVRAGTAHAGAGVGEAAAENVAGDAAVAMADGKNLGDFT